MVQRRSCRLGLQSWERTIRAVDLVKKRLLRATALEACGSRTLLSEATPSPPGSGRVDEAAVRFTQDVDLLIARSDLDASKVALEAAGFIYRHVKSVDLFLDEPEAKARDAVHVVFAGEKVRPTMFCQLQTSASQSSQTCFACFALTHS